MGEETVPKGYEHAWAPSDYVPLSDFLEKHRPSMVQNDAEGKKPWIWVRGDTRFSQDEKAKQAALKEGGILLREVTERVKGIKEDASIPVRATKDTKNKKKVQEEVQAEATEKLKEIATKHGYLLGKWMLFASENQVDFMWSDLATSLVSGPLAATSVFLGKVATSPLNRKGSGRSICLYVPNVYDRDALIEIMKVLGRHHGIYPGSIKSNMYSILGIDSKHASRIQPTTWKNAALLPAKEFKALKKEYLAELKADDPDKMKARAKAIRKPKPADSDPYDPYGQDAELEEKRKAEEEAETKKRGRKRALDRSDEEDVEERPLKIWTLGKAA